MTKRIFLIIFIYRYGVVYGNGCLYSTTSKWLFKTQLFCTRQGYVQGVELCFSCDFTSSFTVKELTTHLHEAPDWLSNVSRKAVWLHLICRWRTKFHWYFASDWWSKVSRLVTIAWQLMLLKSHRQHSSPCTYPWFCSS